MAHRADSSLQAIWYAQSPYRLPLIPLAWIYGAAIACRRFLYAAGVLKSQRVSVPVIIVGNITAGGTGKTPLTVWLAQKLDDSGMQPAIISRGYRGKVGPEPVRVTADSDPATVGDEALLMARRCDCPVIVHPDRVAAAKRAIELGADIIVSDDGLQHYRLQRDFEIAVVDGDRLFGNRQMLPAGPLREPLSRLHKIDQVLIQRESDDEHQLLQRAADLPPIDFRLHVSAVCRLDDSDIRSSADFSGTRVHALAGIGNPKRFFRLLEANGIDVNPHPLPDHARLTQRDLDFGDGLDVLMTEKDAVKCRSLDTSNCWYVPVDVVIDDPAAEALLNRIRRKTGLNGKDRVIRG